MGQCESMKNSIAHFLTRDNTQIRNQIRKWARRETTEHFRGNRKHILLLIFIMIMNINIIINTQKK